MDSHFQFTVPDSKEHLNSQIKRLTLQQERQPKITITKDGTVYLLEFDSNFQKESFEAELNEKFPTLFF